MFGKITMLITEIIKLYPKDWSLYREIRLRSLREEPAAFSSSYQEECNLPPEFWKDNLIKCSNLFTTDLLLFARRNNNIIGMIGGYLDNHLKKRHVATICSMYVDLQERQKGIGKLLISHMLNMLSELPKIIKVQLTVNTTILSAIKLYQSFDFKIAGTSRKSLKVNDQFFDEYFMERQF